MIRTVLLLATLATVGCAADRVAQPDSPDAAKYDAAGPEQLGHFHGLELPATFSGTLPCADCPGIRHELNLWPDGVFHLRREWLGRGGSESDLGRWRLDPSRKAILLYGGREMPLQFEVKGPRTLRQLDIRGRHIESDLPYELTSDGTLSHLDLDLSMHGMFRYLADAARFEVCYTGRSYPVAMEGDYLALERAYVAADKPAPGAPLMASFEGQITERPAMEGDQLIPTVVVQRFVGLFPSQTCERAMSEASLPNTYWRIVALAGEPIPAVQNRREPHLILRLPDNRYRATVGCNQLTGSYAVNGERISFRQGASTRMACPPPLDVREERLRRVLGEAQGWNIAGQTLELLDREGANIATFEAVYLP
jgi:heat shock protein HslJ